MNKPLDPQSIETAANLSRDFVAAMAHTAASVNIVTTTGPAGRFGLTVSAVTSISAEPPLLLACINRRNPLCNAISANGRFAVNTLTEAQIGIARSFAGHPKTGLPYDYSLGEWCENEFGGLLLKNAATYFTCALSSSHDQGTHRIFIGEVLAASTNAVAPLVYTGRQFGRFQPIL